MAQAKVLPVDVSGGNPSGDIYLVAMPLQTYQTISDVAAKRNMSFAQALGRAIEDFIGKTTEEAPAGPRLLVETQK